MKTPRSWMKSGRRTGTDVELFDIDDIREIQADAMRAGLEVAIERMKQHWDFDIVRAIARELCLKNGLPEPTVPFDPTRNPPTPSEVPPPKTLENLGNAPRPEPGYPPPVTEPGPLFPSQSPPPANPPPKDCFEDPKPLEPTPDPTSLNPWEESVVNFLGRHQKRLDVLEEARELKNWQHWVEQRLNELEADLKRSTPTMPVPVEVPGLKGKLWPLSIEAPPGDYEGQQVNAVLKWTGGQWLLLQSHPR